MIVRAASSASSCADGSKLSNSCNNSSSCSFITLSSSKWYFYLTTLAGYIQ
nr:MAG TPA: hypothetical protein [Caudoviricetes sp.]